MSSPLTTKSTQRSGMKPRTKEKKSPAKVQPMPSETVQLSSSFWELLQRPMVLVHCSKVTYTLPEKLLLQESAYFRKHLVTSNQGATSSISSITLPRTLEPSTFPLFVEYIFTQKYTLHHAFIPWSSKNLKVFPVALDASDPKKKYHSSPSLPNDSDNILNHAYWPQKACFWAWVLGSQLGAPGFMNFAMKEVWRCWWENSPRGWFNVAAARMGCTVWDGPQRIDTGNTDRDFEKSFEKRMKSPPQTIDTAMGGVREGNDLEQEDEGDEMTICQDVSQDNDISMGEMGHAKQPEGPSASSPPHAPTSKLKELIYAIIIAKWGDETFIEKDSMDWVWFFWDFPDLDERFKKDIGRNSQQEREHDAALTLTLESFLEPVETLDQSQEHPSSYEF